MAAAVSPIASSGATGAKSPHSTAAVLEFACLFTHDLKRKQKRWQDGRLKYHTFNKRVMVYDERGFHVGDVHWQSDLDLDEGDEIQLERGVLTQVSECLGSHQQDLSELVDRRVQERERRQQVAAARTPLARPRIVVQPPIADHFQARHRPLHQVIGTPTGHHGRAAVPRESPYEERQRERPPGQTTAEPDHRPSKRSKYDAPPSKSSYAQGLFGAPLTLSCQPTSSISVRHQFGRSAPGMEEEQCQYRKDAGDDATTQTLPPPGREETLDVIARGDNLPRNHRLPGKLPKSNPHPTKPPSAGSATVSYRVGSSPPLAPGPADAEPQTTKVRQAGIAPPIQRKGNDGAAILAQHKKHRVSNSKFAEPRASVTAPEPVAVIDVPSSPDSSLNGLMPERMSANRRLAKSDSLKQTQVAKAGAKRQPLKKQISQPLKAKSGSTETNGDLTRIHDGKQSIRDGPRTALRIKSRRKRGLLMVSELVRQPSLNLVEKSMTSLAEGPSVEDLGDPFASLPREDPQPKLREETRRGLLNSVEDSGDELADASTNSSRLRAKRRQKLRKSPPEGDDRVQDNTNKGQQRRQQRGDVYNAACHSDGTEPDPHESQPIQLSPAKRKSRRRAGPKSATDTYSEGHTATSDHVELRQNVPIVPRLARLSKKNIKSREVIGLPYEEVVIRNGLMQRAGLLPHVQPPAVILAEDKPPKTTKNSTEPDKGGIRKGSADAGRLRDDSGEQPTPAGVDSVQEIERQKRTHQPSELPPQPVPLDREKADRGPGKGQQPGAQPETDRRSTEVGQAVNTSAQSGGHTKELAASMENCSKMAPAPELLTTRTTLKPNLPESRQQEPNEGHTAAAHGKAGPGTSTAAAVASVQPRRIANPATRGRKAALKADACGQVLQNIMPNNMLEPTLQQFAPHQDVSRADGGADADADAAKPAKRKMRFPGFVSANNGGPWSREADDLFGTGRPAA